MSIELVTRGNNSIDLQETQAVALDLSTRLGLTSFNKLVDMPFTVLTDELLAELDTKENTNYILIDGLTLAEVGGAYLLNSSLIPHIKLGSYGVMAISNGDLIYTTAAGLCMIGRNGSYYFYIEDEDFVGGFTCTEADVEAIVNDKMFYNKTGLMSVRADTIEQGVYYASTTRNYFNVYVNSATKTKRYQLEYGDLIFKGKNNNITIIGSQILHFVYDSENEWWNEPIDIISLGDRVSALEERLATLEGGE